MRRGSRCEASAFLIASIMARVQKQFARHNHSPSQEQLDGLQQIATAFALQAHGHLSEPSIYLSSLDPGVGKSTVINSALLELRERMPGVGALVFLNQVRDIGTAREGLIAQGYPDNEIGIIVSNNPSYADVAAMGNPDPSQASVLFTTQAQIEKRCASGCRFADLQAFWYRGAPRAVRAWDEAILPFPN